MNRAEYLGCDGLALGELVNSGGVSASEAVEASIELIEELNPSLNAVVFTAFDIARDEARRFRASGQPFAGVPLLLKDLMGDCAGMPSRRGSRLASDAPLAADGEQVRRLKAAGFIAVGKTNTPEFGLVAACEPQLYGPARNPWNTAYSTGGSSGGSAAAVAAGMTPVAHANDYGGSIRVPASCCGLVGLKPTRARIPLGPRWGDFMSGLQQDHVVTRTVRDTAAVLDIAGGAMRGDPYPAPPPPDLGFLANSRNPPPRLRIAMTTARIDGSPFDAEVSSTLEAAGALCEGLGHTVELGRPAMDFRTLSFHLFRLWAAGVAADIDLICREAERKFDKGLVEPLTVEVYELALRTNSAEYLTSLAALQTGGRDMATFFDRYDVWLYPTLGDKPLGLGEIDTRTSDYRALYGRLLGYNPYSWLFNMSGGPSISLPLGQSTDSLPLGISFGADVGNDDLVVRLARQIEEAAPWRERRPPTPRQS